MADGYEYDIFLSYPQRGNAGAWVDRHFHPLLRDCLCDEINPEPRVFYCPEQQTGAVWPDKLAHALKRSRMMVAIWSAPYFRSLWCMAEWQSMLKREKMLGMRTVDKPWGLVYPVIFSDGPHFHPTALATQARKDLRNWAIPHKIFEESPEYVHFHRCLRDVATELAHLLPQVPKWDSRFPIIRKPKVSPPVRARIPRVL